MDSLRTNYVDPSKADVTSLWCLGAWWEAPGVRTFEFELPFQGKACKPGQYAAFMFDKARMPGLPDPVLWPVCWTPHRLPEQGLQAQPVGSVRQQLPTALLAQRPVTVEGHGAPHQSKQHGTGQLAGSARA